MQRTLVILKPDTIQRGLIGEVTKRFEQKGLKLVGMKMLTLSDALLKEHYAHIADEPFYSGLSHFMKSFPVVAQCWEGKDVIKAVRNLCGATNAREAQPGTIRGDLSMSSQYNIIHASDSELSAKAELKRFFHEKELFDYDKTDYLHVYSEVERNQ